MSKRKAKSAMGARHWRVIGEFHIGKFRIMLTKEIVLPRKIRSDKGTHKTNPESVSDPRD